MPEPQEATFYDLGVNTPAVPTPQPTATTPPVIAALLTGAAVTDPSPTPRLDREAFFACAASGVDRPAPLQRTPSAQALHDQEMMDDLFGDGVEESLAVPEFVHEGDGGAVAEAMAPAAEETQAEGPSLSVALGDPTPEALRAAVSLSSESDDETVQFGSPAVEQPLEEEEEGVSHNATSTEPESPAHLVVDGSAT